MNRLKKVRSGLGLSQMQMAELVGATQPQYSNWENERIKPRNGWEEKLDELEQQFFDSIRTIRNGGTVENNPPWEDAARYWATVSALQL